MEPEAVSKVESERQITVSLNALNEQIGNAEVIEKESIKHMYGRSTIKLIV